MANKVDNEPLKKTIRIGVSCYRYKHAQNYEKSKSKHKPVAPILETEAHGGGVFCSQPLHTLTSPSPISSFYGRPPQLASTQFPDEAPQ